MTTYTKPAVRSSWGQTATGSDLQDPGDTYASKGWQIGLKPPRQYENWVLNYTFSGIRYLCQQGIPTWDATETYPSGANVVGPAGGICRSLQNNNINQNPNSTFGTWWGSPTTYTPANSSNDGSVANTQWVHSNFLPVSATFNAINGQLLNAQVPVGAVTQWQGSLSISGGQVTSAVARANTLLVNGYATFNWSGQSGQPTWLFGSNDGTNIFVWNPSNFSVANANTVAGLSVTSAAAGSTVMSRDSFGDAYVQHLNQASQNSENTFIAQIMVTNGVDNFLRKIAFGALVNALVANGLLTSSNFPGSASLNGYQKFPNGIIIQWGFASGPGFGPAQVSTSFPIAFPNQCFATFCNTFRTTGGAQGANFVSTFNATGATYVFDLMASPANTCGGYFFAVGN